MATFLQNSVSRVDQAVNAVFSGAFPNGSGVIFNTGDQTIGGDKTFSDNLVSRGGFDASGNVSGRFSPHNDGLVNLGETGKRFGTIYSSGVSGSNAYFDGNLTVGGVLTANIDLSSSDLNSITATGTGFFQNLRVTGTSVFGGVNTFSGNSNFSGTNNYFGTQNFDGPVSFSNITIAESGIVVSGSSSLGIISSSGITVTGLSRQIGNATLSGTLNHTGAFLNSGSFNQYGNLGVVGNLYLTGTSNIYGSSVTISSNTLFTTGTNVSDRFRVIQPVDVTGDVGVTGSLKVSSSLNVVGDFTIGGSLNLGGATINGSTNFSGNVGFTAATGVERISFNGFIRPKIIAQGLGTQSITSYNQLNDYWSAGTVQRFAIANGVWITNYTGLIGEMGLFLTGSTASASANDGLPIGTYGRPALLVNVGVSNGSGVWHPLGISNYSSI